MKKILLILLFLNLTSLHSQVLPGGTGKTRYNENESKSGKFLFSLGLKSAKTIDNYGFEFGGKAGIMANENVFIGLGFYSLLSHNVDFNFSNFENTGTFLQLGYGGAEIEYLLPILSRTHLSFGSLIGTGTVDISASSDIDVPVGDGGDWFFIIEPYTGINFRFYESFHVGFNFSYRIISGVDFYGMSGSDISGPVFSVILKSL